MSLFKLFVIVVKFYLNIFVRYIESGIALCWGEFFKYEFFPRAERFSPCSGDVVAAPYPSGRSEFLCKSSFAPSFAFLVVNLSEQRWALKFCIGNNAAETVVMLNPEYKDSAMGKTFKCASGFLDSK